jgi:RNA polymerase sigma-70 factor (ECF subfamily)
VELLEPVLTEKVAVGFDTDAALARSLLGGEADACRVTWDRYAPLVRGIVRRAFGQVPEVDDLTQEVFFRLFRRVETLRQPESLRSFVAGFAFRVVHSARRKRHATSWLVLTETGYVADSRAPTSVEARFEHGRLTKTLSRLSPRERSTLLMRRVEGMKLAEIARAQRLSLATIKRVLRRAEAKLDTFEERAVRRPAGTRPTDDRGDRAA